MNAAQLIELYGLIIATIVAIIINPYNSIDSCVATAAAAAATIVLR